jgi:DNA-directed RNA polymerase specialized sigma24 family protein
MAQSNHEYQPDPVTMVAYHRALAEHADSLKAYASRLLGDSIAAEDVAQDAFLALYRHLNQVPSAVFRPFTPQDHRSEQPDEVAETREAQEAIEQAISELPTKFREAFLLCEVEGMSYEDAAAVMGCPVKTVSTRLFRARQRFTSLVSRLIKV